MLWPVRALKRPQPLTSTYIYRQTHAHTHKLAVCSAQTIADSLTFAHTQSPLVDAAAAAAAAAAELKNPRENRTELNSTELNLT